MRSMIPLSLVEQILEHLREGFRSGHWRGKLPGVRVLARELGVSKDTVEVALRRLENEGYLKSGGPGRCREVVIARGDYATGRVLRVGVFLSDPLERINLYSQKMFLEMIRRIENAGHVCFLTNKSMRELGNKLPRIIRMVEEAKADAWVLYSAPCDVLEWFDAHPPPALAIGGASDGLSVASSHTDLTNALYATVRALSTLGHRRIVTIAPDSWRATQSKTGQAFLAAMEECGNHPTSYNLPAWDMTPQGLEKLLESLFQVTPPTALLFVDPATCVAALGFLGLRGLRIPTDISVLCMAINPVFDLIPQRLAHFRWPVEEHIRRVIRWVECLAKGATDRDQLIFHAAFDPGESVGHARNRTFAGR